MNSLKMMLSSCVVAALLGRPRWLSRPCITTIHSVPWLSTFNVPAQGGGSDPIGSSIRAEIPRDVRAPAATSEPPHPFLKSPGSFSGALRFHHADVARADADQPRGAHFASPAGAASSNHLPYQRRPICIRSGVAGCKDMAAQHLFILRSGAGLVHRNTRNRPGFGADADPRGNIALNPHKQAIFPHERVIVKSLVQYGIGAM